jgi:hypothetical protein
MIKNMSSKIKKKPDPQLEGFHLVPDSAGIILNGIFVKDDGSEIIIKSAFGVQWILSIKRRRKIFIND